MDKKFFLNVMAVVIAAIQCVVFSSCGSDDSEDLSLSVSPSSVTLHYDETVQLRVSGNADSWESEDLFVAKVNTLGSVTGGHVGTTRIKATQGSRTGYSTITIVPKYDLYDTPITKFGTTKETIKSKETHSLSSENNTSLVYTYSDGIHPCVVVYLFEDGRMNGVAVSLNYSDYNVAGYCLLERYQPAGISDDLYIFLNADTKQKATMAVVLGTTRVNGSTITMITYMPYQQTSSTKQLEKASLPMLVTLLGMVMEVNPLQPENYINGINDDMLSLITTVVK